MKVFLKKIINAIFRGGLSRVLPISWVRLKRAFASRPAPDLTRSSKSIPVQPKISRVLVAAAAGGRLVPFVGSGISRNCGSPDWTGFALGAAEQALGLSIINKDEYETLVKALRPGRTDRGMAPRTALSIIAAREKTSSERINYAAILHPKGMDYGFTGLRIFAALGRIASTFITTNYDRWLDHPIVDAANSDEYLRRPTRTAIFDRSTFSPEQLLREQTVIHLHGRCMHPESMVISTLQYLEHYRSYRVAGEEESRVSLLLRTLFRDKCVVFLGYSLGELEILEYVLQKGLSDIDSAKPPRHFILLPFKTGEEVQAELMTEYFRAFGVEVLCYSVDHGHERIADVLERLAASLPSLHRTEIEIERQLQQLAGDI